MCYLAMYYLPLYVLNLDVRGLEYCSLLARYTARHIVGGIIKYLPGVPYLVTMNNAFHWIIL